MTIGTVFLIIALILFILAGIGVPVPTNLVAWGLACCVAAWLFGNVVIRH